MTEDTQFLLHLQRASLLLDMVSRKRSSWGPGPTARGRSPSRQLCCAAPRCRKSWFSNRREEPAPKYSWQLLSTEWLLESCSCFSLIKRRSNTRKKSAVRRGKKAEREPILHDGGQGKQLLWCTCSSCCSTAVGLCCAFHSLSSLSLHAAPERDQALSNSFFPTI